MLRERIPLAVWLAVIVTVAQSDRVLAQDSRVAIIEAQQAEKAGVGGRTRPTRPSARS